MEMNYNQLLLGWMKAMHQIADESEELNVVYSLKERHFKSGNKQNLVIKFKKKCGKNCVEGFEDAIGEEVEVHFWLEPNSNIIEIEHGPGEYDAEINYNYIKTPEKFLNEIKEIYDL